MKAIVYHQYGSPDVLKVEEVAKPLPKDNEVLVKIHAAPVNYGDLLARNFKVTGPDDIYMPFLFWVIARLTFGVSRPKINILGSEFAGIIEATGREVKQFRAGDAVFGYRGQSMGAYAEYVCMPETGLLATKPASMTFEEAAAVPYGALTALSLLRKVNIQPGQQVLVNGASGSIGAAALQLARYYGAEITGVCGTPRLEFVKSLGADRVIDYTQEDFTQSGETYDLIVDVLGKCSFGRARRALKPGGRVLYASFKMKHLFQMLWTGWFGRQKVICALSSEKPEDMSLIKELCEGGQLKSIIDRCFPMEQAAEAHRYVEDGHKQGSVVISIV